MSLASSALALPSLTDDGSGAVKNARDDKDKEKSKEKNSLKKKARRGSPGSGSDSGGSDSEVSESSESDGDKEDRRPWTKDEDVKVMELVKKFGTKKWSLVGSHLDGRTGKQCRERW